jgi:hypothetical protein
MFCILSLIINAAFVIFFISRNCPFYFSDIVDLRFYCVFVGLDVSCLDPYCILRYVTYLA